MKTSDFVEKKEKKLLLKNKNSKVFSDDYIPDEIMFRDIEIDKIIEYIIGGHGLFIIGNVGTGKTIVTRWIIKNFKSLEKNDKIFYIYQSCRWKSYNEIWYEICSSIGVDVPKRQSIATYSTEIQEYVESNNIEKIILFLDEADEVSGRYTDPDLFYLFGDTSYYQCILIGNTQEWIENIGIRTASRLGGNMVILKQYDKYEMKEIINQRIKLSSKDTPIHNEEVDIIVDGILEQLISLREAIKIISLIYDYKTFNKIDDKLDKEIIIKFFNQVKDTALLQYYKAQSPILRYTIVCATLLLTNKNKDSFTVDELTNIFNTKSDNMIKRRTSSSVRRYLKELETYGFFREKRKSRNKAGYNLIYTPKFDVKEFELFFKTERIIK